MRYFKRIVTYDNATQNYKVEIPELNITVLGDTEMGAMLSAREEMTAKSRDPKWENKPIINGGTPNVAWDKANNRPINNYDMVDAFHYHCRTMPSFIPLTPPDKTTALTVDKLKKIQKKIAKSFAVPSHIVAGTRAHRKWLNGHDPQTIIVDDVFSNNFDFTKPARPERKKKSGLHCGGFQFDPEDDRSDEESE